MPSPECVVRVSPEQAKMLADANAKRVAAIEYAQSLLTVLSAGHVPPGAVLERIDIEQGALHFRGATGAD